jgi:hypothetical protein
MDQMSFLTAPALSFVACNTGVIVDYQSLLIASGSTFNGAGSANNYQGLLVRAMGEAIVAGSTFSNLQNGIVCGSGASNWVSQGGSTYTDVTTPLNACTGQHD